MLDWQTTTSTTWLHFQQLMTGAWKWTFADWDVVFFRYQGICFCFYQARCSRVSDRFQIFHQRETTTILSHQMINIVCQKSYCTNTQIHEMLLTWGDSTPQFNPSPAKTHRITSDFFQNSNVATVAPVVGRLKNEISYHPIIPSSHLKQVQYDNWQVPVSYYIP